MISSFALTRREFVGWSAAVVGGTLVSRVAMRIPGQPIGVAVIGLGPRGQILLDLLSANPNVSIVALCDPHSERLAQVIAQRPGLRHFESADFGTATAVFSNDAVKAVVIATDLESRASLTIAACRHQKDVYVEAPLALDSRAVQRVGDIAARYGRLVQHGAALVDDTETTATIRSVASGHIGTVRRVRVISEQQPVLHGMDDTWQDAGARAFEEVEIARRGLGVGRPTHVRLRKNGSLQERGSVLTADYVFDDAPDRSLELLIMRTPTRPGPKTDTPWHGALSTFVHFDGDRGSLRLSGGSLDSHSGSRYRSAKEAHLANFIAAVGDRSSVALVSPVADAVNGCRMIELLGREGRYA